jgi:CheY-like chemotaxis protein
LLSFAYFHAAMQPRTSATLPTNRSVRSVLLVEDEPSIALTLCDDLEERGYTVTHTSDGIEALRLIGTQTFEAVITDLRLPGADGLQVVRAVRHANSSTRIMVITAFVPDHGATLIRAGAGQILKKPFFNHSVLDWLADPL